jgi:transposase-like protein
MKLNFDTIIGLIEAFPTEQSRIEYLEKIRWHNDVTSPYDSTPQVYNYGNNQYRCKNTGKDFNVRTGTMFHGTKVPLQKWFMAIWLLSSASKGISSIHLSKQIDVIQLTAWFIMHRTRTGIKPKTSTKLSNAVELDETFIGGKNKNWHWNKKVKNSQGRSLKDKTAVLGMLERRGRLLALVVPDTSALSLIGSILSQTH